MRERRQTGASVLIGLDRGRLGPVLCGKENDYRRNGNVRWMCRIDGAGTNAARQPIQKKYIVGESVRGRENDEFR